MTGWVTIALIGAAAGGIAAAADGAPAPRTTPAAETAFATVNGNVISVAEYDAELNRAFRARFYHGRPPEAQMAQLRRDVGDALIEQVLLVAEAKRRGITPDAEKTRAALAAFESRYGSNPQWQQRRDELLPKVTQGLQEQNLVEQLERSAREVQAPGTNELLGFYDTHRDAFTEPERLRLSIILLKVDPGAPQAERDKAREDAQALRRRLVEGADFAALARERSGDRSAAQGGDMGYVHRGMLSDELHAKLDGLAPGALSEPTLMLEGVAIFRIDERQPPKLRSFEESKERAAKLWQREREEQQWRELKARLRGAATIEVVDRTRYPAAEAKSE